MEAFFLKHLKCDLAVEAADGRPRGFTAHGENIAAAEKLDLDFGASCTERVKLPGKIANDEVDVAVASRRRGSRAKLDRKIRKHGMAERPDLKSWN